MEGQAHSSVNAEAQKVFTKRRQEQQAHKEQEQQTITVVVLCGCDNYGNPINDSEKWMLCPSCRAPEAQTLQSEDGTPLPASSKG